VDNANDKIYLLDFVIHEFFEEKDRKCSPKTIKLYEIMFENILSYFKKDTVINNLKKTDLKNYADCRLMNGLKEGFLIKELKLLKNIFNFAVDNEMLENNPFANYNFNKIYKDYEPRDRDLTSDECQRLVNNCNSHLKRLVIFLLEEGTRIDETLHLLLTDIHTDTKSGIKYIKIRKEISKSKRNRIIPLSRDAIEQINKQMTEFPNSTYIFTDSKGNCYKSTPKKAFYNAVKKAGITPVFGFHTLRHTFACQKLQGLNYKGERIKPLRIEVIAEVMGHKDINVTKKIYARFCKDTLLLEFTEN
jgi:integrase